MRVMRVVQVRRGGLLAIISSFSIDSTPRFR